jgi:protein involved in polysaccharide export with SLBB domain
MTEDAYLKEAEIARLPEDRSHGELAVTQRVALDSTYLFERTPDGRYLGPPGLAAPASGAPEITLRPYDNVLILRQPDWDLQRTVSVTGQVKYPGRYSLLSRSEKLLDILNRAGGLTKDAYPDGIQFYRKLERAGRVGIDLPQVLKDSSYRDNLVLADGDSIVIPEYNPIVYVDGAVNSPVAVSFVRGKDIDYYVGGAGGYTAKADKKRAYVTQADGSVEEKKRGPTPEPGSRVYVPSKEIVDRPPNYALYATIGTLVASLSTVLVVALTR